MVLAQPLPSGPRGLSSPGQVFSLSLRDVELILAERGIVASCETVRRWCQVLLQTIAVRLHDVPRVIVTDKLRLSVGCFLAWSTDKADI
jgi:hypothetical protein